MVSRYLCGSLALRLVARGEELILFSSYDKYLGTLTMSRQQVSVIAGPEEQCLKVQHRRHCGLRYWLVPGGKNI